MDTKLFFVLKCGPFLVFLLNILIVVDSSKYFYTRINQCVLQNQSGCVYWESKLEFQKKLDPSCFPQDTYVQGRQGKIKISNLKVGDEVLVYKESGLGFQKIEAWLHRQVEEQFEYRFIRYQATANISENQQKVEQNGFYISGMHNIALLNQKDGKISYQFAQNLVQGDFLYGHGSQYNSLTPRVIGIGEKNRKKGVYAPYTRSGNYFVASGQHSDQLILVHCFAHVSTNYHYWFDFLINLYPLWNVQPDQASYIHPLSSLLKDLFPSVIEMKSLNNLASELTERHHKFNQVWDDLQNYEFRQNKYRSQRKDFRQERKMMVLIDKVFSTVQLFG